VEEKRGIIFSDPVLIDYRGNKKKKPPSISQGFFRELEFKVFFRTVNQAGFSGIFGCFSGIG
jgi:hypothetical protein